MSTSVKQQLASVLFLLLVVELVFIKIISFSSLLQSVVVSNGGLGNGVSREELSAVLKEIGEVETLLMPPHKPYAFVTYRYSWCKNHS